MTYGVYSKKNFNFAFQNRRKWKGGWERKERERKIRRRGGFMPAKYF
jgi:hypothetical protein